MAHLQHQVHIVVVLKVVEKLKKKKDNIYITEFIIASKREDTKI